MGCCESKTDYGSNMGRKPKNNLHHKQEPSDHQPNNQDKIHFDEKQDNNHKWVIPFDLICIFIEAVFVHIWLGQTGYEAVLC